MTENGTPLLLLLKKRKKKKKRNEVNETSPV